MPFTRVSRRSDYRYPTGAFDVRGFDVRTQADGEKVGKVDDVLVSDDGSPRYLEVGLGLLKKHVLLPVGQAFADQETREVRVPGMTKEDFERIPETVEESALDRDYEARLAGAYSGALVGARAYARPEYRSHGVFEGRADREAEKLARVDELDEIAVAEGQADPQGWSVLTADGERVGRVDHLIGDTEAMRVRYLTVDLATDTTGERHVLIPTGFVELDADTRTVRLNALESSVVRALPRYEGSIDGGYAERLDAELGRADLGGRWYEHPRYSMRRLYGKREGAD